MPCPVSVSGIYAMGAEPGTRIRHITGAGSPSFTPRVLALPFFLFLLLLMQATACWAAFDGTFDGAFNGAFDPREATIASVHDALFTGRASCRTVVSAFLSRIEAFNPALHAVVSLNPDALATADRLDAALAAGNATGRLFCVPILLKDNFDAVGMSTTAGCRALAGHRPRADAPTVRALRDAGGVVLGKTNLHELALEGLTVSSLGGQTVNPYDGARTPGGSSGGTGAALAASLAVLGTGTDTVNSLRSPASANALVSVRPTRGLVSRAGIVPVSYTQDTAGPMARTVADLAVALTVMAGVGRDPADNATMTPRPPGVDGRDYAADLDDGGRLAGRRLGVLRGFFNRTAAPETTPVNEAMDALLSFLAAEGVELVDVDDPIYDAPALLHYDVQTAEYREMLDGYLAGAARDGTTATAAAAPPPRSFAELYAGSEFLVIPGQYDYIRRARTESTDDAAYAARQESIRALTATLHATLADHGLDALVYPQQRNLAVPTGSPSQSGRNGILAALTGSPVVALPAGFSAPTATAPLGVPIGLELLGPPFSEAALLRLAARITRRFPVRRMPAGPTSASVDVAAYADVPALVPDARNIAPAYPVGVLS